MLKILPHELDAEQVMPVLRKHRYKLPGNVNTEQVRRWHKGFYYGYGCRGVWIPLNAMGGIATKGFWDHSVKFPLRIDRELRMLLLDRRLNERFSQSEGRIRDA
jgi:hypothetical protein